VTAEAPDPLPPEAKLALAWSTPHLRSALSIALQLDRRLARIVGRTHEPMLGQMRLAWWREALGKRVEDRPRGDAVLDGIGHHWQGREAALARMVDGWEVLVTAESLDESEAEAFASGRGAFFAALASGSVLEPRLAAAGRCWALAEAAAGVSDPQEKAVLVTAGLGQKAPAGRIPRALGGLAVLESLARRSLLRGGRPLMEGRGASLAALRGAIFRA
jgi:phytoene synthase